MNIHIKAIKWANSFKKSGKTILSDQITVKLSVKYSTNLMNLNYSTLNKHPSHYLQLALNTDSTNRHFPVGSPHALDKKAPMTTTRSAADEATKGTYHRSECLPLCHPSPKLVSKSCTICSLSLSYTNTVQQSYYCLSLNVTSSTKQ